MSKPHVRSSSARTWYDNLSLTRKLTAIGVAGAVFSLMVAAAAVLAVELSSARARMIADTRLLADVIGSNSTAAIVFGDPQAASETVRALSVNVDIVQATI